MSTLLHQSMTIDGLITLASAAANAPSSNQKVSLEEKGGESPPTKKRKKDGDHGKVCNYGAPSSALIKSIDIVKTITHSLCSLCLTCSVVLFLTEMLL